MRTIAWLLVAAASSSALALPPNSPHREGANHRVGDDSFTAKHGRAPTSKDSEKTRMRVHLEFVRAELAKRPATKPELEKRRAELLGYLDDYIAKGITPTNWNLPWRTPVFIDDDGAICAVGYLIQRSVGRALPERIAASHKFDYLEDIAAAMPEVASWIASSGFTHDELASIQPGYTEPDAQTWRRWTGGPDGEYETDSVRETWSKGHFKNGRMQGPWVAYASKQDDFNAGRGTKRQPDQDRIVVGRGEMKNGAGKWTSLYPDGKLLAEGWFSKNDPNGTWRFYHPSGNVAAIGNFTAGRRTGRWEFFHDTAKRTPIAFGRFDSGGFVTGRWEHFNANGTLIASSHEETPSQWKMYQSGPNSGAGELIHVVPGADGIKHSISQGTIDQSLHRLDTFARGGDRVYVYTTPMFEGELVFDTAGHRLDKKDGQWTERDCTWSSKRRSVARSGDVAQLHGLLFREVKQREDWNDRGKEPVKCNAVAKSVDAARGKRIDALLASRTLLRAQTPKFVRDFVLASGRTFDANGEDAADKPELDLVKDVITRHMSWYVEWPHIDGRFVAVFRTLPGHHTSFWWDKMDGEG
jgi:antitoxin component YwqK of YwqJK toxin-antitoxin module